MNNSKVKSIILDKISLRELHVSGNEYHMKIIAVGDIFIGLTNVEKQQIIYEPLKDYIINNTIHSISIESYTLEEWSNRSI
ncbi:BolA/IbaG family iron-sulfur metabolism protein [Candidatus Purcelliella pentastirinorum]|uniref:BolA/IbaG family iron-sulfur metabolism protein n=1 Tax=Candidatus Purcelliella pentastirinorum TaxID=472834 RepID=A0AAX3N6V2_9ENTR|nr:BolA/IbaG family iron-sulfur metabolism protein [Candidatus Purcelliella pentastirinorum]WDI78324.1 BolA/IbaG family iron-sulfur metabolism protein [Candidatus Purcelliella pentastirinorum]WDR80650.1 BolA/IbaG family iron-sulfur metabolism protein [Candidatus Purcelliella pentastirinorum]